MKHRRTTYEEPSSQDLRGVTVLGAPPSLIPASLETMLFSCILLFLFFGGTIGCLTTGFSIPVYPSVLCFGIPALTVLLLFCDRLFARIPLLYLLPPVILFVYVWQRIDVLRDGCFYIAAAVMRYLCWGFPGLDMPQPLTEYDQFLIHAETNDLLLSAVRAPVTETLLLLCVGLGFVWIFLYQHNQSTWLSAALPLPVFILCFLIIETTVPALWALLLILLYWVLLLFTRTTLHLHIRAAATQVFCLILPCILFLLAVYLWYPRETPVGQLVQSGYDKVLNTFSSIETTVSDAAGNLFSGRWFTVSAEGSEISFESLGPRRFLGRTVMRAKSDTPGVIYLRENTYGRYTDDGWKQLVFDGDETNVRNASAQAASAQILAANPVLVSRLTLDGARSSLLFSPYYFYDASIPYVLDGDSRIDNPDRISDYEIAFYRFSGDFHSLQYHASSASVGLTMLMDYAEKTLPAYLEIDGALAQELRAILEDHGIVSHTDNLVTVNDDGSVTTYYGSDLWDTVSDITYFVRGTAEYSLNALKNTTDRDFVLWFLEDAEYGYCTHFATAEVMLLRACGIPARLASGFLCNIKTAGNWTAIKDSNAHAWVEVFDVHLGWIPVEATPPGTASDGINPDDFIVGVTPTPSSGEPDADTEEVTETDETTAPAATETITEEISPTETTPPPQEQTDPESPDTAADTTDIGTHGDVPVDLSRLMRTIGRILLILTGIGAVLAIPILFRQFGKKRVSALLTPAEEERNASALRLYRRCVSLARACGEDIPAALTAIAEKARFSQHLLSREELHVMAEWYRVKCSQLQKQDKPLDRLRHFWFDIYY